MITCDDDSSKWWPVLYVGKTAKKEEKRSYVWKLRDELVEALKKIDLSKVRLYTNLTSGIHYWFLNANPKIWSMANMPVGEVQAYTLYNDNGNKRRIFPCVDGYLVSSQIYFTINLEEIFYFQ